VASKTCHKKDSTTALGYSGESSVQHSPAAAIPEFDQRPDDGGESGCVLFAEDVRDVFPEDPTGAKRASQFAEFKGEHTAPTSKSCSEPSD
jgi:hypothetical protein